MNLNYGYDNEALMALVNNVDGSLYEHNLVIDYDGEVILDPEIRFPNAALSAYKFCTTVKDKTLHSNMMVRALYDALEIIFDKLSQQDAMITEYYEREMNIAA